MNYPLEEILISPRVYQSWKFYTALAIDELLEAFPDLRIHEIGEEQFEGEVGQNARIFVEIPTRNKVLSMNVPADEWMLKK